MLFPTLFQIIILSYFGVLRHSIVNCEMSSTLSIESEKNSPHYTHNKNEKEVPHKWYVENSRGDIKQMEYLPPHWRSIYSTDSGNSDSQNGKERDIKLRQVEGSNLNPDLTMKYVSPIPYHLYTWKQDGNLPKKLNEEEEEEEEDGEEKKKTKTKTKTKKKQRKSKESRGKKQKRYNGLWSWNQMKKQKSYYQTITPNITQGPIVQSACSGRCSDVICLSPTNCS